MGNAVEFSAYPDIYCSNETAVLNHSERIRLFFRLHHKQNDAQSDKSFDHFKEALKQDINRELSNSNISNKNRASYESMLRKLGD